jgi:hypothetical protein
MSTRSRACAILRDEQTVLNVVGAFERRMGLKVPADRRMTRIRPQSTLKPPRRYAHFLFAAIQSALTSSIAAAIASFNLIWAGGFLWHWLQSWFVAWIAMLPLVIVAAPAILRLSELMTRPDELIVGNRARPVLSTERSSEISEPGRPRSFNQPASNDQK